VKKFILIANVLLFAGCATFTSTYNTPFINADETILLEEGMSKNRVLKQIGEPLYVDFGVAGTVVWIYEVRTVTVLSELTPTGGIVPNKTHNITKHSTPIHRLSVTFVNGKVISWETTNDAIQPESPEPDASPESPISKIKSLISSYINI
jgi:outer membrane protein assembly factor BamE (lipoprotein component of BamABCDE complex)